MRKAILFSLLLCLAVFAEWGEGDSLSATVQIGSKAIKKISPYFVGVTLDTTWILSGFCHINFERAIKLGQALGAGYLRVGGSMADFSIFRPNAKHNGSVPKTCDAFPARLNYTITKKDIDTVVWFARSAGWRLIYDFNGLLKGPDGLWNSQNARLLLDYMDQMGYNMDFQLGNEPDLKPQFKANNSGWVLAQNYKKFRMVLNQYSRYRKSKLVGPAMAGGYKKLLRNYLMSGATKYTDAVTFHHYYGAGKYAKVKSFLSPRKMNEVKAEIRDPLLWTKRYNRKRGEEVWLGETSSFYGGGAPNISDRYVAGFLWLDKLGISAQMGLNAVIRQTFFMANYPLVDAETNPNPDYFLTLLYKRLVGNTVLPVNVSTSDPAAAEYVRCYAHCNDTHTVVYGLNVWPNSSHVSLSIDSAPGKVWQYLLEPAGGNLTSKHVELNGNLLKFDNEGLSPLTPKLVNQPISFPQNRFAFFVFTGGCKQNLKKRQKSNF